MPKGEFFFVISAQYAEAFWRILSEPYFSITMGNDDGDVLLVFMASKVLNNVSYKELHKIIKETLK